MPLTYIIYINISLTINAHQIKITVYTNHVILKKERTSLNI